MGREGGKVKEREELDYKDISTRVLANSMGESVAGRTLQKYLELE